MVNTAKPNGLNICEISICYLLLYHCLCHGLQLLFINESSVFIASLLRICIKGRKCQLVKTGDGKVAFFLSIEASSVFGHHLQLELEW